MYIDWEAECDNLSNGDGESRVPEKNLAQSIQKIVREFRKWWDRYLPSLTGESVVNLVAVMPSM